MAAAMGSITAAPPNPEKKAQAYGVNGNIESQGKQAWPSGEQVRPTTPVSPLRASPQYKRSGAGRVAAKIRSIGHRLELDPDSVQTGRAFSSNSMPTDR
jgi:hypothetical protein